MGGVIEGVRWGWGLFACFVSWLGSYCSMKRRFWGLSVVWRLWGRQHFRFLESGLMGRWFESVVFLVLYGYL